MAIHEAIDKADGIVFRCTLSGSAADRWLEVPAWMFDRARCLGTADCCARTPSGQAAAAPPNRLTNSAASCRAWACSQVPPPIIAVGTAGCRRLDASGAWSLGWP